MRLPVGSVKHAQAMLITGFGERAFKALKNSVLYVLPDQEDPHEYEQQRD